MGKFRIYMINHNYYLQDEFDTLEDAIRKAKSTSFECRIDQNGKPVYTVGPFGSHKLAGEKDQLTRLSAAIEKKLAAGMGLHVIKYPSGKFGFAGSVPKDLVIAKANGDALSDAEFNEYKSSSNPAMVAKARGYKTPSFATEAEAIAFAKKKGHSIAQGATHMSAGAADAEVAANANADAEKQMAGEKKIEYAKCKTCGVEVRPHWLKDGVCNGCRNPDSVVKAEPKKMGDGTEGKPAPKAEPAKEAPKPAAKFECTECEREEATECKVCPGCGAKGSYKRMSLEQRLTCLAHFAEKDARAMYHEMISAYTAGKSAQALALAKQLEKIGGLDSARMKDVLHIIKGAV